MFPQPLHINNPAKWLTGNNGNNTPHIVAAEVGETVLEATTAAIAQMTTETAHGDTDRGRLETGRSAQIVGSATTMMTGSDVMIPIE